MARRISERKIPFNCYLTLSQLEDLEAVSSAEGKPKAELVREAITEYLVSERRTRDGNPLYQWRNSLLS